MKKLLVLFLGLFLCVSFAQSYTLSSISKSSVQLNGTDYNCSSTFYDLFLPADLGDVSTMLLDAACKITETQAVARAPLMKTTETDAVYLIYSFDKINWTNISLIGSDTYMVGPSSRTKTYSKSNQSIDLSGFANGVAGTLYLYFRATDGGTIKTDPTTDPTVSPYEATFTKIADIYFYDGSGYTPPAPTKGNTEEVIGRFYLEADVTGATLTDLSIEFDGTRTGFSNFKLWSSTDNTFGSDTHLGTVASDPGESPAVFSSISSSISTDGAYYFLTAGVDIDATGSIRAYIGEAADLTVTSGIIGETIASAPLTSSEVPTSICLSSFIANVNKGKVELTWVTESEKENSHFLIYRDNELIAKVAGSGTCSNSHTYIYTDRHVMIGEVVEYRLSDVSLGGVVTVHTPVIIEIGENVLLGDFILEPAYPNPFNPRVVLSMEYVVGGNTVLNIYNTQGVLVDQLTSGFVEAGTHEVTWDASNMPSGVYVVTMRAGNTVQSQKIVLMK